MGRQSPLLKPRQRWLPVLLALLLLSQLPAQESEPQEPALAPRVTDPHQGGTLIQLKVIIADLEVSKMNQLGIDWLSLATMRDVPFHPILSDPSHPARTKPSTAVDKIGPEEPVVVSHQAGASQRVIDATQLKSLDAALEALRKEGAAKILSRPQLVTLQGRAAALQVGGEVAWTAQNGNEPSNARRTLPVGLMVAVMPTVADEDAIELDLTLEYGEMQIEAEPSAVPFVQAYHHGRVKTRLKIPQRQSGVIRYALQSGRKDAPNRERLIVLTPEIVKPLAASEVPQSKSDGETKVFSFAPREATTPPQVWSPKPRSSANSSIEANAELQQLLQQIYPNETIQIFRARSALVLRGTVHEASEIPGIVEIAEQFAPVVINQLRVVAPDETASPRPQEPVPAGQPTRSRAEDASAFRNPVWPLRSAAPQGTDPFESQSTPTSRPADQQRQLNPQPTPGPRVRIAPESEIHQLRSEVRALRQDVQTLIRLLQQRTRQPAVSPPFTPVEPASQPLTEPNAAKLQLRTYNVADLVVPIPQFGEADHSVPDAERSRQQDQAAGLRDGFDKLVSLITSTVQPDSWESPSGGTGRIIPHESTLSIVVRQTPTVHQLIEELLEQLRRLQDWQVGIESRVIRSQDLPQRLSNSQRDVLSHQGWVVVSTDRVQELIAAENVLAMPKVTLFNGQQVRLAMPRGDHAGSGELNCQLAVVVGPERRKVRLSLTVDGVSIREASLPRQATLLVRIPSNDLLKDLPDAARAKLFKQPGEQGTAYLLMSPQIIHQGETGFEAVLPKTRS